MNAILTITDNVAVLVAQDDATALWLKHHPSVANMRRQDVHGKLAVIGAKDTMRVIATQMAAGGLNVQIERTAA